MELKALEIQGKKLVLQERIELSTSPLPRAASAAIFLRSIFCAFSPVGPARRERALPTPRRLKAIPAVAPAARIGSGAVEAHPKRQEPKPPDLRMATVATITQGERQVASPETRTNPRDLNQKCTITKENR